MALQDNRYALIDRRLTGVGAHLLHLPHDIVLLEAADIGAVGAALPFGAMAEAAGVGVWLAAMEHRLGHGGMARGMPIVREEPVSRFGEGHAHLAAGKRALGAVVHLGGQGRGAVGGHVIGPGRRRLLRLSGRLQERREANERTEKL